MTSAPSTLTESMTESAAEVLSRPSRGRVDEFLQRVGNWVEVAVDRANPILVKEVRQALKSRQFVLTFLVVLIACWVASFAVVAIVGPDVYYVAEGSRMLSVYIAILAFPLVLIVPYSAFRSLAVEQEDNTYELLSITTLSPGKIIAGKLGSVTVQMLVYLSAVSPCIAFTFLLRGVDALTVAILLGYFVLESLGLSMLALLAGTVARVRYSQALISVILVLGLAGAFFSSLGMAEEFIRNSYSYIRDVWFWVGNLAALTFYLTTFALLHAAAAAQVAFPTENRSTPLRRIMLLQHACCLSWISGLAIEEGVSIIREVVLVTAIFTGIYWYFMGTLLTSEWPHLSRRVQRSLPQSKLGCTFFTWLNPGPGTGYMFCVANVTMVLATGLFLIWLLPSTRAMGLSLDQIVFFMILSWCYVVFFLGLGRLLIGWIRRFIFVSLTAGFLLHVILLLVSSGAPQILIYTSSSIRFNYDYSLLHLSNPFWTLYTVMDRGIGGFDIATATLILLALALIVFLLNVRAVAGELQLQRRALPQRVVEEEEELHPAPEPGPSNPWDNTAEV